MGSQPGPTSLLPLLPPPHGTSHSLLMQTRDGVAVVSAGAGTSLAAGGMRTVINLVYYCRSLEAPGHLGAPILAKPKENAMGTQKAFLQPRDIVPAMFSRLALNNGGFRAC